MAGISASQCRSLPTTITLTLSVRNGARAIDFYREAFGAEVSIQGAGFFVADESPPNANFSPATLGGTSVRIALLVADPDAVQRRAVAAGAREVYSVADQDDGYRLGRVEDHFGHHWEIGRSLR